MTDPIHFGWFVGQGFGVQGWRKDSYPWGYKWYQPAIWEQAGRVLEQAGFDFLLLKDGPTVHASERTAKVGLASAEAGPRHETQFLVPYLLNATERLGIVTTINSSHYDPFIAARNISTLYHFDGPRVGINVVTSGGGVPIRDSNFQAPSAPLGPESTYERADEWITIVKRLWESWDRDAVVEDDVSRVYARWEGIHPIDFHGKHFDVPGPTSALPFQDEGPIIAAPSNSSRGLRFVAEHADVQFGYSTDAETITWIRDQLDAGAHAAHRDPSKIRSFANISPKVVGSKAEKEEYLRWRRSDESLDRNLPLLSVILDHDLTTLDYDAPIPNDLLERWTSNPVSAGVVHAFLATIDDPATTPLREIGARSTHGQSGDIVGTAEEIADYIEEIASSGTGGIIFDFNVDPESLYGTLVPLVPVLRRRGLLRTDYVSNSLRENLAGF